jgi:tRNA(Ile)-lysidine synthase
VPGLSAGLTETVFAALGRRLDIRSRAPIALALSGGGDSLALLILAADWARARGRPLLALTVDHRLHPDSAAWTAFAGEAAINAGADWRALPWIEEKPASGLPAAARAARHRLLADAAREAGAAVILFGHTADDVLEGEMMREAEAPRLGYLKDWSPSPVWPEGRGLFLLRPLLGVRRQPLRRHLRAKGAVWLDDPANADPRSPRARARKALQDATAPPSSRLMSWSGAGSFGAGAVRADDLGVLRLARADLPEDAAAARRLIALMVTCASGREAPPRGEALDRLHSRLLAGHGLVASLAGARVTANEDSLAIGREPGDFARRPAAALQLSPGARAVWDGRFEIAAAADLMATALAGLAARLPKAERTRLNAAPPAARAAVPALRIGEIVRLPAPFGDGPAVARSLVKARFDAAAGLIGCEREIKPACEGRTAMAESLQSSYVEDLALA